MAQALIIDLFRVLLFPKDPTYLGDLDPLYLSKVNLPNYKFSDYFEFNTELIDYLRSLSSQIPIHLYTAAQKFLEAPEAKNVFSSLFKSVITTQALGMRKTDVESFQLICSTLMEIPKEVVYVGDNLAHVEAAKKAGIQAIHYTFNSEVIPTLKLALNS